MEQRQQKSALILKYAKRRFDGGNECELIRAIERQQEAAQLKKTVSAGGTGVLMAGVPVVSQGLSVLQPLSQSPFEPVQPKKASTQVTTGFKKSKVSEILLRGPLQVCIGLVGILTASLAIVTFRRAKNEVMLQQGWQVLKDCIQMLKKGLKDTVFTPVTLLKWCLPTR